MCYILSFDIGIKNLAYCYSKNEEIIEWKVLDISGADVNQIASNCILQLEGCFGERPINKVLIENQPVQKNPTMKTIQIIVYTFFMYKKVIMTLNADIVFVSASKKNKYTQNFDINIECNSKYQKNKKQAVACTRLLLTTEWMNFFTSHKKKDDLADSYLQTLSYINYTPVLPKPLSPRTDSSNESTS